MSAKDRYLDGSYLTANPLWGEDEAEWKASLVHALLRKHPFPLRSVIEVGSGSGGVLLALHRSLPADVSYTGYEIAPAAFDLCQSKARDRLTFQLGDLAMNQLDEPVDLALALDVIEHVEDYFDLLRNLGAASRYQVLHIPLDVSVQTVLRSRPFQFRRDSVGHIHFFTKETALAALNDAGLDLIDMHYTAKQMNLTTRAVVARHFRRAPFRLNSDLTVRVLGGYSLLVLTCSAGRT